MKMSTWIDRSLAALAALAIAHWLGPVALGEWSLMLVWVWILSPWPERTLSTRLVFGFISLGLISVSAVFLPWTRDREVLMIALGVALFAQRALHALPASWGWRLGASSASVLVGLGVLIFTRSLLAGQATQAAIAALAAIIGVIRHRYSLGVLERVQGRGMLSWLVTVLLQGQILLWVRWRTGSIEAVGQVAASLYVLEMLKASLAAVAGRFDEALRRFSATRESFLETVRSLAAYGLLAMPPIVLLVYFAAAPIMIGPAGTEFSDSVPLLRILVWGFACSFFSLLGARVLRAKSHVIGWARGRVSGGLIEALLAWIWIPMLGVEGACYARVVGEFVTVMVVWGHVHQLVPGLINPFRKTYG